MTLPLARKDRASLRRPSNKPFHLTPGLAPFWSLGPPQVNGSVELNH